MKIKQQQKSNQIVIFSAVILVIYDPLQLFQRQTNLHYIHLPKLVSTEQVWNTFHTDSPFAAI